MLTLNRQKEDDESLKRQKKRLRNEQPKGKKKEKIKKEEKYLKLEKGKEEWEKN